MKQKLEAVILLALGLFTSYISISWLYKLFYINNLNQINIEKNNYECIGYGILLIFSLYLVLINFKTLLKKKEKR